jgi:nitrite reductase (NO-forming)
MKHIHIGIGVVLIAGLAAAGYVSLRSDASEAKRPEAAPVSAPAEEKAAEAPMPTGMPMKAAAAPEATKEQEAEQKAAEAPRAAPAKVAFTVNAGSFYFVPNALKVKKGDTVTINLVNDGGFHDFTLDALGVKLKAGSAGETTTATFVAGKVGSYEYYCSVGRHRELGQKGTLVVE